MIANEIAGITEDNLKIGDIIATSKNGLPMIVGAITPMPVYEDNKKWLDLNADQIAYLKYDAAIAQKFTQKKTSRKLEKTLAKNLHGNTTPGSGAFNFHKGDVITETWLAEHKFTNKSIYRLALKTWNKITQEAFGSNKKPLMEIVLNQSTSPLHIILINLNDFSDITQSTEEEFVQLFRSNLIETDKQSLELSEPAIRDYFNTIRNAWSTTIPALLIKFNDITLLGMETQDFTRIFKDGN